MDCGKAAAKETEDFRGAALTYDRCVHALGGNRPKTALRSCGYRDIWSIIKSATLRVVGLI